MLNLTGVYKQGGKIVKKKIPIPITWKEVTFEQYCKILANTNKDFDKNLLKQISILTGITVKELKQFSLEFIERVGTLIAFSYNLELLESYSVVPKELQDFKVGKKSFGNVLEIKKAFRKIRAEKLPDFCVSKDLCKVYINKDVSGKPITEVLGYCNFFLSSFLRS